MISSLKGCILEQGEQCLTLDVRDVGYEVYVPESVLASTSVGDELRLYTYFYVREDAQQLYGFTQARDKDLFVLLISVSGVGPKMGSKMISDLSLEQIVNSIVQEDIVKLTSISGVGKKMAERLILELKDKMMQYGVGLTSQGDSSQPNQIERASKETDELFQAMRALGYSNDEIKRAYLKSAMSIESGQPIEDSIKIILKAL